MNANLSQPHPAERGEIEHLLPSAERELPAGRHQFHTERLMTRIHDDLRSAGAGSARPVRTAKPRSPFLHRTILLPAAACVLAGTIATGAVFLVDGGAADNGSGVASGPVLTTRIGTADPKGTTQLLDRISLAAATVSGPSPVREDQFVYIGTKSAGSHVQRVNGKSSLVGDELHLRQTWNSPDGTKGWLIEAGTTGPGGITLAGPTETGQMPKATLNAPTYNYLAALPTDPDVLLRKIYTETRGKGRTPDQEAFTTIGDLLRESYPPAALTVALYKAAAKIPGVVKVDDAVDAAGRHGVAVARLDGTSGQRTEWIFDDKTLAFLGERTVQVEGTSGEGLIKPGTVVFTHAVMTRAIVDRIKQTPAQAG